MTKYLILGDVMLDIYLYGHVGISPEAIVDFRFAEKMEMKLGGAGNIVSHLSKVGTGDFICCLGQDIEKELIMSMLMNLSFEAHWLDIPRTTTKTRYLDQTDNKLLFRISNEIYHSVNLLELKKYIEKIDYDIMVISDYDKGLLNGNSISLLLEDNKARPYIYIYI